MQIVGSDMQDPAAAAQNELDGELSPSNMLAMRDKKGISVPKTVSLTKQSHETERILTAHGIVNP